MSHPDPTQEYPCENCGDNLDDCECGYEEINAHMTAASIGPVTSKNEFEQAADSYLSAVQTQIQIDSALRRAFYAGVQHGINTAQKIYRPEPPPSNKCPACGTNGAHYCPADIARS